MCSVADAYDNSMAENSVSTLSKRELAHCHSWTTPQKSTRVTTFSEHIEAFYNGLGEFEQSVGAATEALAEGVTEGTQGAKDGGGRFYDEAFCPQDPWRLLAASTLLLARAARTQA